VSDGDWWARKLGARQTPTVSPRSSNVPGTPPQAPQALGVDQQLYARPQPQQFDPNTVQVTTENLFHMAGQWKGGIAHRVDTQPCPECGSPQYFSRANGRSRLPPPAPHCYNCGYNGGLFDQGQPDTWGYAG